MSQKFQVIVADPAWSFKDSLKMSDVARGASSNYSVMSILDIQQLPVKDYAVKGAILALWVPSSLLQEGLDTMKAWGFKHKQTYVWVKTKKEPLKIINQLFAGALQMYGQVKKDLTIKEHKKVLQGLIAAYKQELSLAFGMGRLFRQTHEICLIGTNNNEIYRMLENKSQRSVSFGENLRHSAKPEHLQDSLEIMFPKADKLELFARRQKAGWTCLGNEICNGEDITVSLSKL